jgi:hypothetical protein
VVVGFFFGSKERYDFGKQLVPFPNRIVLLSQLLFGVQAAMQQAYIDVAFLSINSY